MVQKSADRGEGAAMINPAILYLDGKGVQKDSAEAIFLLKKASDKGIGLASFNLGVLYINQAHVRRDYPEAVKYLQKASDRGVKKAWHELGVCYYNGNGVPQNREEGLKWIRKAADGGVKEAKIFLDQEASPDAAVPCEGIRKAMNEYETLVKAQKFRDIDEPLISGLVFASDRLRDYPQKIRLAHFSAVTLGCYGMGDKEGCAKADELRRKIIATCSNNTSKNE
jgi:TPR repeat protein